MSLLTKSAIASIAIAVSAAAQISYPQDGVMTSQGNLVPFGFGTTNGFDEGRSQVLIPQAYLPSTGALILGMSTALIPGPPSLTYASLEIRMALTFSSTLSSTFDNNLIGAQVVFQGTDVTVQFAQSAWSPSLQLVPFLYPGAGNLVIDIRKVYDRLRHPSTQVIMSSMTSGDPGRGDLPAMLYAWGAPGSGAATSVSARSSTRPIKVRLDVGGLPTVRVRSNRGGNNNYVFAIGQPFDVRVSAPAGTLYATLLSFGLNSSPLAIPGIAGFNYAPIVFAVVIDNGMVGVSGEAVLTLTVPLDPLLVGAQVSFQTVHASPGLIWTNAADALINS